MTVAKAMEQQQQRGQAGPHAEGAEQFVDAKEEEEEEATGKGSGKEGGLVIGGPAGHGHALPGSSAASSTTK